MKRATRKRVKRVVLGVGYPWFSRVEGSCGFVSVKLVTTRNGSTNLLLNVGDLGAYKKIKLVAEIVK